MTSWRDIQPADAVDIDCRTRPDLSPPVNESGSVCPWPWEPQQLVGAPMGQYHCEYCGAMVVAGIPHPDYRLRPEECCTKCGNGPILPPQTLCDVCIGKTL